MPDIDHDSPIPLYYQLKHLLKEKIQGGELAPGARIPTEEELCKEYRISRTPVRQALMDLVREGLLKRTAGRGTFVAGPNGQELQPPGDTLQVVFSDTRWQELLDSALSLFSSRQSKGQVNLSSYSVPLWDIHHHLVDEVGRGSAPDISVLDSVWVAEFANLRHLVPLNETDPDWYQELQEDTYPALLAANSYGGNLWGIPVCGDASVLWYRRDWFEAEKLEPPATWDDLVAVAGHFQREAVRRRYGLDEHPFVFVGGRRGAETTTYQLLPFLWASGGDLIAADRVLLDSPASIRALEFLRSLIHDHCLVPPEVVDFRWDQAAQRLAAGRAALALGGTYEYFFIRESARWDEAEFQERIGFVPIPAGQGAKQASLVGGMNYVLYRQSGALSQALALLKVTTEPEILKPFCERTGQIPARISVAKALRDDGKSFASQTVHLMEHVRTRPSLPGFARVSAQFSALAEDCLSGRRSVEQAVSLAADRISAITDLPLG